MSSRQQKSTLSRNKSFPTLKEIAYNSLTMFPKEVKSDIKKLNMRFAGVNEKNALIPHYSKILHSYSRQWPSTSFDILDYKPNGSYLVQGNSEDFARFSMAWGSQAEEPFEVSLPWYVNNQGNAVNFNNVNPSNLKKYKMRFFIKLRNSRKRGRSTY